MQIATSSSLSCYGSPGACPRREAPDTSGLAGQRAANEGSRPRQRATCTPPYDVVSIHLDGEHGKRFGFQGWLGKRGFVILADRARYRNRCPR